MKKKKLTVAIQAAIFTLAMGSASITPLTAQADVSLPGGDIASSVILTNVQITELTVTSIAQLEIGFFQTLKGEQFVLLIDQLKTLNLDEEDKAKIFLNLDQRLFQEQFIAAFEKKYGKYDKKFEKELEKELKEFYKAFLPEYIKAKVKVKEDKKTKTFKIEVKFELDKKKAKKLHLSYMPKAFFSFLDFEGMKESDVRELFTLFPDSVTKGVTDADIKSLTLLDLAMLDFATLDVTGIKGLSLDFIADLAGEEFILFADQLRLLSVDLDDETKAKIFFSLDQNLFQQEFITLFEGKFGKNGAKKYGKALEKELKEYYKAFLPSYIKAKVKVKEDKKTKEIRVEVKFDVDKKAYKYMTPAFILWLDLESLKKNEVLALFTSMPETVQAEWTEDEIVSLIDDDDDDRDDDDDDDDDRDDDDDDDGDDDDDDDDDDEDRDEINIDTLDITGLKGLSLDFFAGLTGEEFILFADQLRLLSVDLDDETKAKIFLNLDQRLFQEQFIAAFEKKYGKYDKKFKKELEKELKEFYKAFLPSYINAKVKVKEDKKTNEFRVEVKFDVDKKAYKYMTPAFIYWIDFETLKRDEIVILHGLMPLTVTNELSIDGLMELVTNQQMGIDITIEDETATETSPDPVDDITIIEDDPGTPSTLDDDDITVIEIDFPELDANAIIKLSLESIAGITAEDFAKIPLAALSSLTKEQVAVLDISVLESLTLEQLSNFSAEALSGLSAEAFLALKLEILEAMGFDILMSLNVEVVEEIVLSAEGTILEWISGDSNVSAWIVLNYLDVIEATRLELFLTIDWTVITLDDGSIQFELTESAVKALSPEVIASLTVENFALFDANSLSFWTAEQIGSIDSEILAVQDEVSLEILLPQEKVEILPPEVLAKLFVIDFEVKTFETVLINVVEKQPAASKITITLVIIEQGGHVEKIETTIPEGWTFDDETGQIDLTADAVTQLSHEIIVNITAEQIVHLNPVVFSHFTVEQVASLPAEAMAGFSEEQVAELNVDVIAVLTAEQIVHLSVEAVAAFTQEQFASLSADALSGLTIDHFDEMSIEVLEGGINANNIGGLDNEVIFAIGFDLLENISRDELEKISTEDMLKIVLNINADEVKPAVINTFLAHLGIEVNVKGKLKFKKGKKIKLPKKHRKVKLSATIALPELPDLEVDLSLGGNWSASKTTVLSELNQTLAESYPELAFEQKDTGILIVQGSGSLQGLEFSFIPEEGGIEAVEEDTAPGVSVNAEGRYVLITASGYKVTFMPMPKAPELLLEVTAGGSVEINEYGETQLEILGDNARKIACVFSPMIQQADEGLAPGITIEGKAGVNEVAKVVYKDGTMQVMHPAYDRKNVLLATSGGMGLNFEFKMDGTIHFDSEGFRWKATPELTMTPVNEESATPYFNVLEFGELAELVINGTSQLVHAELIGEVTGDDD